MLTKCLLLAVCVLVLSCCGGRAESVSGKTVLVTGGNSGIGAAVSKYLAAQGAKVLVTGRRVAQGEQVVKEIIAAGGEAFFQKVDVTSLADISAAVRAIVAKWGRLDVMWANSGYCAPLTPLVDQTPEKVERVYDVNLLGATLCGREALKTFKQQEGEGVFIVSSSLAALLNRGGIAPFGELGTGFSAYCASKAAANMLVRSFAGLPNVRSYALDMSCYETPMLQKGAADAGFSTHEWAAINPVFTKYSSPPSILGPIVESLIDGSTAYASGESIATDNAYTWPSQLFYDYLENPNHLSQIRDSLMAAARDVKGNPSPLTEAQVQAIITEGKAAEKAAEKNEL